MLAGASWAGRFRAALHGRPRRNGEEGTTMRIIICFAVLLALLWAGCAVPPGSWPDRTSNSAGEMLADVVRWQQRSEVRESTGELADECFTEVDFQAFVRNKRPERVVACLKAASDFGEIVSALRSLPPDFRAAAFDNARAIARPTWAMMGYI